MKIGMRNLKTALAVFLCIVIFQLLNMGSPFYAAVAAIISMQSSVVDSFKTGKNRILGTLLGALVGFIFALLGPSSPFLIGLGIIIIISVSNWLNMNKSISIAGVVFIAIMVNLSDISPLVYSINRIIDTLIGIVIAVLINYFISPPINLDRILKHSISLISSLFERLKMELYSGEKININELKKEITSLEKEITDYKMEFKLDKHNSYENSNIKKAIELLGNIFDHLKIIDKLEPTPSLSRENCSRAMNLLNCTLEPSQNLEDEIYLVYNYHIGKILDYVESLNALINNADTN